MKLKTSLTASRDGSIVDATDENLIHDAAAAHALMMAMAEFNHAGHLRYQNPIYAAMCRADEIMAQWGFDSGKDAEIERLTRGNIGYAQDNVNLTRLAETKLAYLRERGYTQQAVVMTGPGGCCTVSNLGRVIWLKDPSELAITGAERTAQQIHDEAGMPPNGRA